MAFRFKICLAIFQYYALKGQLTMNNYSIFYKKNYRRKILKKHLKLKPGMRFNSFITEDLIK